MALCLVVIAPLVVSVVSFLFFTNLNVIGVIPSYRSIVFPILLLLFLLRKLPSFICAGGFSGLSGLGAGSSGGLAIGLLYFLWPGFLGAG